MNLSCFVSLFVGGVFRFGSAGSRKWQNHAPVSGATTGSGPPNRAGRRTPCRQAGRYAGCAAPHKRLQLGIGDGRHDHREGIDRKPEKGGLARRHELAQLVGRLFESDPIVACTVEVDGAAVGTLALHDGVEMAGQQGCQGMGGRHFINGKWRMKK